jgi:hypothetical protein
MPPFVSISTYLKLSRIDLWGFSCKKEQTLAVGLHQTTPDPPLMAKIVSVDSVAFNPSNDSAVSVFLQLRISGALKDEIHYLLFWKVGMEEEGPKDDMFAAPSQCVECGALRRWEHHRRQWYLNF